MPDKPKALFISSRPLYPVIGGDQIRTVQQLTLLEEYYNVDVIYMCSGNSSTNDTLLSSKHPHIGIKKFEVSKLRNIISALSFLFNSLPIQVNFYYNKAIMEYIAKNQNNYDLIFCNNIRTAEYVRRLKDFKGKKVLDFVDAISMNYQKAAKNSYGIKRLIYLIDAIRCRDYERLCLESFDKCAAISSVDASYILNHD